MKWTIIHDVAINHSPEDTKKIIGAKRSSWFKILPFSNQWLHQPDLAALLYASFNCTVAPDSCKQLWNDSVLLPPLLSLIHCWIQCLFYWLFSLLPSERGPCSTPCYSSLETVVKRALLLTSALLPGLFCVLAKHWCSPPAVPVIEGNTAGGCRCCRFWLRSAVSPGAIIVSRCLSTKLFDNSQLPEMPSKNPGGICQPRMEQGNFRCPCWSSDWMYSRHTNPWLLLVARRKAARIKAQWPVFSAIHQTLAPFGRWLNFLLSL